MNKTLLVVDDDLPFRERLSRSMEKKGFKVNTAESFSSASEIIETNKYDYAIVDMRLSDGSGLELIKKIQNKSPLTRSLLLTGYGNIATAVAAVKAGAIDYLAKPADADEIDSALNMGDRPLPPPPENPMSADRVRWEHIQRVFQQCDCNVSETARRLGMHRRTLQRILAKYSPNE